jgi:hypothetical protein
MHRNNRLLFLISFLILANLACDVNPDRVGTAAAQTGAALAGRSTVEGAPVPPMAAA